MKRVVNIENGYHGYDKYVLTDEYNGFGIYRHKTPTGYFVNQTWLVSNHKGAELVIESYNDMCKEEVLDIIDNYNETNKFGVKAVMYCNHLHMHCRGDLA